jgi:hypothetical protein
MSKFLSHEQAGLYVTRYVKLVPRYIRLENAVSFEMEDSNVCFSCDGFTNDFEIVTVDSSLEFICSQCLEQAVQLPDQDNQVQEFIQERKRIKQRAEKIETIICKRECLDQGFEKALEQCSDSFLEYATHCVVMNIQELPIFTKYQATIHHMLYHYLIPDLAKYVQGYANEPFTDTKNTIKSKK